MANVDENVVQMTFDNFLFEKRLADTIKSLDSLKLTIEETAAVKGLADIGSDIGKNLDLTGIQGSLADLNKDFEGLGADAGKEFNVAGISAGIQGVSKVFLGLSTVALSVIKNITDRAVNAGITIAKSLSFDQLSAGFGEYELNINSIQTILANTKKAGTTLSDVTGALDELNEYADQTIYNFAQMTQNIGSFTAQGVDLNTAVASIKGISNAAAIAGSNSAQAGAAMYNLAQAIGEGSLRLMNWNSVVNAGMGGTVMQEALFTTGKAMGTLTDVKLDTTFQQWQDAGNNFRDSLADGWITAEVLTTTLQGFSGDFTDAELSAKGFTDVMIQEFRALGELGVESATKVRTFTQLIATAKEAVGSGWSQSFRILLGDFNQATDLFTSISEGFGKIASDSTEARNALLQGWVDLGGRANLIDALGTAFYALGRIMQPIKEAFRVIFPKTSAKDLQELTQAFAVFTQKLIPTADQMDQIKVIAKGFFSVLKIGWEIVKETIKTFVFLGQTLADSFGGGVLDNVLSFSETLDDLRMKLVTWGGVEEFFQKIRDAIAEPGIAIDYLKSKWEEFTTKLRDNGGIFGALILVFDAIKERLNGVSDAASGASNIWDGFKSAMGSIVDWLEGLWESIKAWFNSLGERMAEAIGGEGQFDGVLDALNTGLIAAIAVFLGKFAFQGIDFNFFTDVTASIEETLGQLTSTLAAMQSKLQSDTLSKLAIAIGVLAASVLVLSLIDSAALTKALTAMAVGFGQLVGAMTILAKLGVSLKGAGSLGALAVGLILLASAILILSIAVKILSTMGWEELAKGLGSVIVLLGSLVAAVKLLQGSTAGMFQAGAGLLLLSGGLLLIALAMKMIATMGWEEIAKGLVGIAGSLILIAAAMHLMPKTLPLTAAGLVLVGAALNLIAASMKVFATMGWEEIGKGLVGVAGSLVLIAGAMHLMPLTLPITAAGLILVGVALGLIATAVLGMGSMSLETLAKGIGSIAAVLLILAVATNAMTGAVLGAVAIGIVSGALVLLAVAMTMIARLSIAQIATSLIAIAAALAIIGVAAALMTPVIPVIIALGAGLLLLGAAFLLIGAGAALAATAFATFAGLAGSAIVALLKGIGAFLKALPEFFVLFVEALAELIATLTEYAPQFFEFIQTVLTGILETIIEMTPLVVEAFIGIVKGFIKALVEIYPEIVAAGIALIMALLDGIGSNIKEIVEAAGKIITEFLGGLAEVYPKIIAAGTELITNVIKGIGNAAKDIVKAGAEAIISFLEGVASNVLMVIDAGFQIVIDFLNGLADSIEKNRGPLVAAGFNLLDAIFGGVLSRALGVLEWFGALPGTILGKIINFAESFAEKGRELIRGIWTGIVERWAFVRDWFGGLDDLILEKIGDLGDLLYSVGKAIIQGLWDGMKWLWDHGPAGWIKGLGGWIERNKGPMAYDKVMLFENGKAIMTGLHNGMLDGWRDGERWVSGLGKEIVNGFDVNDKELTAPIRSAVAMAIEAVRDLDGLDANPVISPVLDLTNVRAGSKELSTLLGTDQAYNQALAIAQTRVGTQSDLASTSSGEIKFEQNIFAPEQLSTSDIYRNTRTQINMAKEELKIP
jgi:tape measure domain-containing protein